MQESSKAASQLGKLSERATTAIAEQIERDLVRIMVIVTLIVLVAWMIAIAFFPADKVSDAIQALALAVGGLWVLYQYVLKRSFESSLSIDITARTKPYSSGNYLAFIETMLTNTGNRRIDAPEALTTKQIKSYEDSVFYPCDLHIKRIAEKIKVPSFVGIWSQEKSVNLEMGRSESRSHFSLLYEYSDINERIDFFMEPGEKYALGATFVLEPGDYLAKVVFVGRREKAFEFWSRVTLFHVPGTASSETQVKAEQP